MNIDTKTLVSGVTSGGFAGVLLLVLITGYRGDWVYGSQYAEMKSQRDEWKGLAIAATKAGERLAPAVLSIQSHEVGLRESDSPEAIRQRVEKLEREVGK